MSQPGSPQAAGSGPEAMLASLLLQLQQGQAEIARTTQEGLKQLADGIAQSAKRPGIVDVKGIGKPDVLKGTHEEVQKVWKTWSYNFETWFSSQWGTGQTALDYARKKGDVPVLQILMQLIHICMWHWYHLPMERHMTLYSTLERSVGWMHGEDFVEHMNLRTIVPISDYFEGFSIPQGPL